MSLLRNCERALLSYRLVLMLMLVLVPAWAEHQHHKSHQHHHHHHQDEEEGPCLLDGGSGWDGSTLEVLVHRVGEGVLLWREAQLLTRLLDPECVAHGNVPHLDDIEASLTKAALTEFNTKDPQNCQYKSQNEGNKTYSSFTNLSNSNSIPKPHPPNP